MPLKVNSVTFDANDPPALARFWATVFETGEPTVVNPYVALVHPPDGPELMFLMVPEAKTAKNRAHLDLHADSEEEVDAEAERLVAAGATVAGRHREHGVYWATLLDPEGNELCVGTPLSEG